MSTAAKDLLDAFAGYAKKPTTPRVPAQDRPPKMGTVDPAYSGIGAAKVTFDGESSMSSKAYVCVNCSPAAGDRVVLLPVGKTLVIIGTINGGSYHVGDSIEGYWPTAPAGFLLESGQAVSRSTYAALFAMLNPVIGNPTVTIASPGVLTLAAHGIQNGQAVYLTTTGALPTGLSANVRYFAVAVAANTFELALTLGGAAIVTTGAQSGVHTVRGTYGVGDGATTFNVPDSRGRAQFMADATQVSFASRGQAGGSVSMFAKLGVGFASFLNPSPSWIATNTGGLTAPAGSSTANTLGINVVGNTDLNNALPQYITVNRAIKY